MLVAVMLESSTYVNLQEQLLNWLVQARHARLYVVSEDDLDLKPSIHALKAVTASLSHDLNPTLRFLLLPTALDPASLTRPSSRSCIEAFSTSCQQRGTTVDFEDTDGSPGGSLVSRKFWRYMKE
ncbi:hypothetical protein JCM11641_007341 [Rhodosporidiobolus odoratus]